MTKHPDRHIPLPYTEVTPANILHRHNLEGPLDVGTYVGQKAAALVAVKRWISIGGSGSVCIA